MSFELVRCTVSLLRQDGTVLLGRKTKKIGVGLYNGPGGVIEDGEDPATATARENFEEIGVRVEVWSVVPVAIVNCYNWDKRGSFKLVRLYVSESYDFEGEPQDSEEFVGACYFPTGELPLGEMLPGDRFWLPQALRGERFYADVHYEPGMAALRRDPIYAPTTTKQLNLSWYAS